MSFWKPIFRSIRKRKTPKKIYCIDPALVTSVGSGILVNSGHLLENLVFSALRRMTPNIYYYKTKGGREVDFITIYPDKTRTLIQVCETLANPGTRKREITALNEAMGELNLSSGILVTRNENEIIQMEYGQINVVTVWRFLLQIDGYSEEKPPR